MSQVASFLVFLVVFFGTLGAGRLILLKLFRDHRRAAARLRDLASGDKGAADKGGLADLALSTLPRMGRLIEGGDPKQLLRLKTRLTQAGIYGPNAVTILLATQLLLLILLPATAGLLPFVLGLLTKFQALCLGGVAAGVGLLTPPLWVDYQRKHRQNLLRRALPDAIDMFVLCVEAGVSLPAALQRVTAELQIAHPPLAREMTIIQREVQLGLSVGDAMQKFGDRCELEEVRQLASVMVQSERYGTSSVKALRLHSECCRQERHERAQERAQKAAVKILFPTMFCIFPAVFIVLVGPAAYQIAGMLAKMK
jgi:tight adherence protein C